MKSQRLFFFEQMTENHEGVHTGLSHPFLGMGPGPLELGRIASF